MSLLSDQPPGLRIVMTLLTALFITLLLGLAAYFLARRAKVLHPYDLRNWPVEFRNKRNVIESWQSWLVKLHAPKVSIFRI